MIMNIIKMLLIVYQNVQEYGSLIHNNITFVVNNNHVHK